MAKTAECSIFDWWDANVVYEEKVLGHPNNRNALFDARIQDEAKRAAAYETIAALKKELKKTAGALEESCRPMVPVLELTMEAIDIWNETGARKKAICITLRKLYSGMPIFCGEENRTKNKKICL